MSNKTFVRVLVIVAIGIPVLIELATLTRLVGSHMDGGPPSPADSLEAETVQYGEDLLPATPQSEELGRTLVTAGRSSWTFELTLEVENGSAHPYRLTLTDLVATDGSLVRTSETRTWDPGEASAFETSWTIPADEAPQYLVLTASRNLETDSVRTATRRIAFGKVPVQNVQ